MRAWMLAGAVVLVGCKGVDQPPSIVIRAPSHEAVLPGQMEISVVFNVEDDRKDPVTVQFWIDGEEMEPLTDSDCHRECTIATRIPAADLEAGEHVLEAEVTDSVGNTVDAGESVTFSVFDVPYVKSIAISDTMETGLDNTIEVELHILDDDTATWLGCAALTDVQEADVQYDDLAVPFIFNEDNDIVLFDDISLETVRFVAIESDNGAHCPSWPALTEELESDVDDLYGISPPTDLTLLFSGSISPSIPGITGLEIDQGRPL